MSKFRPVPKAKYARNHKRTVNANLHPDQVRNQLDCYYVNGVAISCLGLGIDPIDVPRRTSTTNRQDSRDMSFICAPYGNVSWQAVSRRGRRHCPASISYPDAKQRYTNRLESAVDI